MDAVFRYTAPGARLSEHPHPQASSPLGPQAQVLSIFDEVRHHHVNIAPNCLITPLDATDATLVSVLFLIVVAAMRIALTTGDVFPQVA